MPVLNRKLTWHPFDNLKKVIYVEKTPIRSSNTSYDFPTCHGDCCSYFIMDEYWTNLGIEYTLTAPLLRKKTNENHNTDPVSKNQTTDTDRTVHHDRTTNKNCSHQQKFQRYQRADEPVAQIVDQTTTNGGWLFPQIFLFVVGACYMRQGANCSNVACEQMRKCTQWCHILCCRIRFDVFRIFWLFDVPVIIFTLKAFSYCNH